MTTRFAIFAAFALACSGDKDVADSGSDSGTECGDDFYEGPPTIEDATVECTGTSVRFHVRTEGLAGGSMVFSQETANAGTTQWSDEHDLDSYDYDSCGLFDNLERVIDDGSTLADPFNDWSRNTSSLFTCADHYNDASWMSYAFTVNDLQGSAADCRTIGGDVGGMVSGAHDRVNEPSFDLGACTSGRSAM